jgi:hypothetical protein
MGFPEKLDHDRLAGVASLPNKQISIASGTKDSQIQNLKTHRDLPERA